MATLTRRRVITMLAALPGALAAMRSASAAMPLFRWTGSALGADASITLAAASRGEAETILAAALSEIDRLEELFSLYRNGSALVRLNADGALDPSPAEFVDLLRLCERMHAATDGRFDPTIHAAWRDLALRDGARLPDGRRPPVGLHHVTIEDQSVRLGRPGMALSFNGIAQGHITDRIADLFRANGLTDILVNLGEHRALGRHPDGRPWTIGIGNRPGGGWDAEMPLQDAAIATSVPLATTLDAAGAVPQMIDPRTLRPAAHWRWVSVRGAEAAVADAFSTAFSIMEEAQVRATLARWPGYGALLVGLDGGAVRVGL